MDGLLAVRPFLNHHKVHLLYEEEPQNQTLMIGQHCRPIIMIPEEQVMSLTKLGIYLKKTYPAKLFQYTPEELLKQFTL